VLSVFSHTGKARAAGKGCDNSENGSLSARREREIEIEAVTGGACDAEKEAA
jgi:hypothetical protein